MDPGEAGAYLRRAGGQVVRKQSGRSEGADDDEDLAADVEATGVLDLHRRDLLQVATSDHPQVTVAGLATTKEPWRLRPWTSDSKRMHAGSTDAAVHSSTAGATVPPEPGGSQ
eukprot:CAMPEP_0115400138 /NCGR_PEP_ID=MMETSP0271-20121206/15200_1 /TAXON_ID=71861 /ORGANISM="Scrippsiella trochoidea, Strain CCMP3099" /LENGTH=112 /DNA_ID=CAMNT_0002823977 /DNA_START=157 /DNA_END=494 /DNA_ORIENTATION=-